MFHFLLSLALPANHFVIKPVCRPPAGEAGQAGPVSRSKICFRRYLLTYDF
jgi:hypothetical protein